MVFVPGERTMREIYLMTFSEKGEKLAAKIANKLADDESLMLHLERVDNLEASTQRAFRKGNTLVYIGATGIAVRAIAPFLKSKMTDPAVIVVDEQGQFVIPILSGHVGGANEAAKQIATLIGATPVITTATDINHVFAVDVFAVQNGYHIVNREKIKAVSAALLKGSDVGLSSEFDIAGKLPKHVVLNKNAKVGIHIGRVDKTTFSETLQLVPRCYHVGIGAKRETAFDDLHTFFLETLVENRIPVEGIASISSIDLKKDEKAIIALAGRYHIPFKTYTPEQLQPFEERFDSSEFVKMTTGVGNVCEISAWLSAKQGQIVVGKKTRSGMTMAVVREDLQVCFDISGSESEVSR